MTSRVTAVVCAAFDETTDEAIYEVRELVRAAGVTLPPRPPHRPHFSLAAATVDKDDLPEVLDVAAAVAQRHGPVPIRLDTVGRFGRAGVVWLGPARSSGLAALQRDVHESLLAQWPSAFGERSDPAQWVAHCSLATRLPIPKLRAVQEQVRRDFVPISGTIDALATILVGGRGDTGLARLSG